MSFAQSVLGDPDSQRVGAIVESMKPLPDEQFASTIMLVGADLREKYPAAFGPNRGRGATGAERHHDTAKASADVRTFIAKARAPKRK
jgi:hypothetical protein